ncbi:MAG: hypothetical protein H8K11_15850 [Nitrospira sp.]|nr:hypothetical protein [Nitrospira sp.]
MKVLRLSQKKRITQESVIKLKLTEYPAALFEFLTRATQKPKAELAAEILGAALISDRELRRLFAEQAQEGRVGHVRGELADSRTT